MKRHDGTGGNLLCPPSLKRSSLPHANFLPGFHTPSSPISYFFLSIFQEIPHTVHEQAQLFSSPAFPQGSPCQHIPRVPHHRSQSRGSRGLQWAIPRANSCTGVGECLSCPGAPSRRGPGLARGVPEAPPRSQQREPKGREWWTPGSTRGCHLSPLRAVCKCSGTSLHSHTPCREIPCLSLREPSLSRDCSQSSPPACAGDLGPDTLENSGCGSKEGVPKSLTSGFPPVQIITRHHVKTQHTVKHLCSDHFMGDVVCLN